MNFIDNRVWLVDFEFNPENFQLDTIKKIIIESDDIFQDCNVNLENSLVGYANDIRYIEILINKEIFKKLSKEHYFIPIDLKLSELVIRIMENGFLNIISKFDYDKSSNMREIQSFYKEILKNVKEFAFHLYNVLLQKMFTKNILKHNNIVNFFEYHEFLGNVLNDKYTPSTGDFIIQIQNVADIADFDTEIRNERQHEFKGNKIIFLRGNYFSIWIKSNKALEQNILKINTLICFERSIYKLSQLLAPLLLKNIQSSKMLISKKYRNIYNHLNVLLLNNKNIERHFPNDERFYIDFYNNLADLKDRYTFYKDTEEYLRFAIQGVEVEKDQKNNRVIQIILSVFTGLTLFSFIADLFAFLNIRYLLNPNFIIFKSISLFVLTSVIVFMLITIIKKTK